MSVSLSARGVPFPERNVGSRMTDNGLALASGDGDGDVADMIDQGARDLAQRAIAKIEAHEQVCAVRWLEACHKMTEVKTWLQAIVGILVTSVLGLVAFMAERLF